MRWDFFFLLQHRICGATRVSQPASCYWGGEEYGLANGQYGNPGTIRPLTTMDTYFSSVVSEGKRFVLKLFPKEKPDRDLERRWGLGQHAESTGRWQRWSEPSKAEGRAFGRREARKESTK